MGGQPAFAVVLEITRPREINAAYLKRTYRLTNTEIAILVLLQEGISETGAIAKERGVSPNTVKKQISSLLQKMDVSDKVGLLSRTLSDPKIFD